MKDVIKITCKPLSRNFYVFHYFLFFFFLFGGGVGLGLGLGFLSQILLSNKNGNIKKKQNSAKPKYQNKTHCKGVKLVVSKLISSLCYLN